MNKRYICLKPVYRNSLPIVDFKVLSYETLKDARRCKRVNDGKVLIARILPSEVENWERLERLGGGK